MASTSILTPSWVNHVFLSFRGEDTRKCFTDHLFAALERRGIKTFKDNHDLERGGVISMELIKAIEESMFAIIILSPNYASSTWCLDELQKIVECNKTFGQTVFPIFYGVDPSDVRHQRGSFAKAFRKHEENFTDNITKVDTWKNALREIAGYSGWDSKGWNEAALVDTIVDDIQKKLIPKLPSSTNNLVGIDSRIKEVYSLLGMGLNDVRFIGIWGMGGIGKTTIARLVYEAIKEEFKFNDSCFLADIREISKTKGLFHIQRELLLHLNLRSSEFYNVHDGKKIVANSLCNKKVLLVLDDVSELSQLENLAENQEWFGPGSRIIITSRDKHLLVTHGVDKIYEAKSLVETEALKLFCLKAFKRDQPKEEYSNLCKEVVEFTGGLPLALKGTDKIQGIGLCLDEPYEAHWSTEAFSKTSQLWLLKLRGMTLPLGLKCLPSSLKVLDWYECPLKTLPLTHQLDEIVYLTLRHSKIEQLWHGTQCLGKLKSINLSFSESLKQSPDFAAVPNLESLNLEYCDSLTEVHPSLLSALNLNIFQRLQKAKSSSM